MQQVGPWQDPGEMGEMSMLPEEHKAVSKVTDERSGVRERGPADIVSVLV